MELNEKQKKIIKILKEEGEVSTTKIAFLISVIYYQAEKYLEELEKEGIIIRIIKNNATYWRIKDEKTRQS